MKNKIPYVPKKCECCGQTETYILGIDHGTADIVIAVARKIGEKGINIVHPRKEIEGKGLTSNQVGNLSRARFHGLIAKVKGEAGNYLLTRKGSAFLSGAVIPRYAIISKVERRQVGYFEPEKNVTCLLEVLEKGEYWEGIGYDIVEGEVFRKKEIKQQNLFT